MPDHTHRYFLRNTIGISSVELFWGLGMPVVMESTFLQLFLRSLGADNFTIGFIPIFFYVGVSVFSLVSGYFTAHMARKRTMVILLHILAAVPILVFGALLKALGLNRGTLPLFFICYAFFSLGVGLILPSWQNYLVKIFPDDRVMRAHSIMWITASLAKFLSSFVIMGIVERYSFSVQGASMIFFLVGCVFLAGSFFFLFTKEHTAGPARIVSRRHTFVRDVHRALRNRNYLYFLFSDLEQYAVIGILAFYANYASEYCAIKPSLAAGMFVALIYLGNLLVSIFFGWMGLLQLRAKTLLAKLFSLIAVVLLISFQSLWTFLLVSFLFGVSRGTRTLVFAPVVKRLCGQADATNFFAIAPLLTLPLSALIPLLTGKFLDVTAYLGANSYRIMFSGMGLLMVLGIFLLLRVDFSQGD